MWGKSCRRPALLVPCATTAQWASYAISLLSKMRFVWVNRGIITIPEQMCLRCAAKRCRLQDEVCEFTATFQRCTCDLRQANHFAVSLPSVLPSLYPPPPPPSLPGVSSIHVTVSATVTGTVLSVCQPDKSADFSLADCRQVSLLSKHDEKKNKAGKQSAWEETHIANSDLSPKS